MAGRGQCCRCRFLVIVVCLGGGVVSGEVGGGGRDEAGVYVGGPLATMYNLKAKKLEST